MISTGIKGLDGIITGLRSGDNVVWQLDDIADYIDLVKPFVRQALKEKKKVIYIRFASHKEVVRSSGRIKRYKLDANAGFESFTTKVNNIISQEGEGAYYIFDSLSELLSAWATDLMISNFFMVTCPYLYELKTITYFSIMRNCHSFKSIARIRETTQLLMDVYHCENALYIHPLKVWNRYSPTMFLPHQRKGEGFVPITDSVDAVKILSYMREKGAETAKRNLDYWDRLFMESEELAAKNGSIDKKRAMVKKLCGIMVSANSKMLSLAIENFSLDELVAIKSRLIGTGFIGGKSAGMLLARKILSDEMSGWQALSEGHDSFYIGSDIFYSYIVENHWWKLRMQQKTEEGYYPIAKVLKEKMLYGAFSDEVMEHFQQIIEYFGTSPVIVRSSSLLEDGYGNAFAGKYESIFLANQGSPEQRYIQFAEAVKKIYASTMNENALVYRKQRRLDKLDEQMALLVQRVSGAYHKNYFFPDLAGVGVSYNTYVWNEKMDLKAGMIRLVFGLGTRAVNRVEGDYPRIAALDNPMRRPYSERDDLRKFSQHEVDVINIKRNIVESVAFEKLLAEKACENAGRVAMRDDEAMRIMNKHAEEKEYWILTLDNVLNKPGFVDSLRDILRILEKAYRYPVEIEFTANFVKGDKLKINLLQCRPLQTRGPGQKVTVPDGIKRDAVLFDSSGYFLGGNISQEIARLVYIDPKGYNALNLSDKYEIARITGILNSRIRDREKEPVMLMGPGRWGTTTPALGVSVKFAEINNISILAEISFPSGNLEPELSFGTHFFQDLVEMNIFYVALFPEKKPTIFNRGWFQKSKDIFPDLLPQYAKYRDVVRVYDVGNRGLRIASDVVSQKILCFSGCKGAGR